MLNPIDIVDAANRPVGRKTTIDSAMRHGSWHRCVHIVVYTATGYVLLQKRSNSMLMHPGYLDISCGGFVDAGEEPEAAAVREVHEELGLTISEKDLRFIDIRRKNHTWPKRHRHDRAFIYCYAVRLADHHADVSHLQTDEVQWAGFITIARARRLLRLHHLKGLGRIEPLYGFYTSLLAAVQP